jgi:ribosomal protein L37E
MEHTIIECSKCGRHHFAVSKRYAQFAVKEFNRFFNKASKETQEAYNGPASLEDYKHCCRCGNTEFQEATGPGFVGQTLNPIIYEKVD